MKHYLTLQVDQSADVSVRKKGTGSVEVMKLRDAHTVVISGLVDRITMHNILGDSREPTAHWVYYEDGWKLEAAYDGLSEEDLVVAKAISRFLWLSTAS